MKFSYWDFINTPFTQKTDSYWNKLPQNRSAAYVGLVLKICLKNLSYYDLASFPFLENVMSFSVIKQIIKYTNMMFIFFSAMHLQRYIS